MSKHDLILDPPLMNAAGSLGFAPDLYSAVDWSRLGTFVTNPVSLTPRAPAHGRRFMDFPGGFMLHTGYPNPGIAQVIHRNAGAWSRSPLPVIVHLLAQNTEELERMARRLETVEGVSGLELGLAGEATGETVVAFTQAVNGELPVIVRLPVEHCVELASHAINAGAVAVSLAPPRGILPTQDGDLLQGRLYGPAILPMALKAVKTLTRMGIPTIGAGGVYTRDHVQAMLAAGAIAVQLDSILWRTGGYNLNI